MKEKIAIKTKICLKNSIMFSILISIFAQIYIYPFDSRFVLGIGVIAIGFIFSISKNISPIVIGTMAGILTTLIRSIILMISSSNYTSDAIIHYIPAAIFYISYGILDTIFLLSKEKKSIIHLFFYLVCFDIICNVIEILVRSMFSVQAVKVIIVTALIRGGIQCIAFLIYNYHNLYIKKAEHQKRYAELNLMVSQIHAEAFYLQKSTNDLNNVMKEAYNLYEVTKGTPKYSTKALSISQNAHEIRKNNDRVLKGINQLIENVEKAEFMSIAEIFSIIADNTKRQIESINSKIFIEFKLEKDCCIKRYYDIFAVLNNLIINAIEACTNNDVITVSAEVSDEEVILIVSDNGSGIEKEVFPYIFNIGFSTKFNEDTGAMSTGIGLCHVKNLVENLEGTIEAKSNVDEGTEFIVKIPIMKL